MEIKQIFDEKIEEIKLDEIVCCILLVGSNNNLENLSPDKDIDLFVFTYTGEFMREIVTVQNVHFDITYLPITLFEKENNLRFINTSLKGYTRIYQEDNIIDTFLDSIKKKIETDKIPLTELEINYLRLKLSQDYEDIQKRMKDSINAYFLMSSLFRNLLISYFDLHRLWLPKDKKILDMLKDIDKNLYASCTEYIKEVDLNKKFIHLKYIMNKVLNPFGGMLTTWEKGIFPLK